MSILGILIVGLFSGFLAGKIVTGHGFGVIGDIIIGIVGAFVGNFFFSNTGFQNGSLTAAVLTSTCGSIVFLLIAGFIRAVTFPRKT